MNGRKLSGFISETLHLGLSLAVQEVKSRNFQDFIDSGCRNLASSLLYSSEKVLALKDILIDVVRPV